MKGKEQLTETTEQASEQQKEADRQVIPNGYAFKSKKGEKGEAKNG